MFFPFVVGVNIPKTKGSIKRLVTLENALDAAIRVIIEKNCPLTGRFDSLRAVFLHHTDNILGGPQISDRSAL